MWVCNVESRQKPENSKGSQGQRRLSEEDQNDRIWRERVHGGRRGLEKVPRAECWGIAPPNSKQKAQSKLEDQVINSVPAPSDRFPLAREVTKTPYPQVPPPEDQAFKHVNRWGTFFIQTIREAPPFSAFPVCRWPLLDYPILQCKLTDYVPFNNI